ncbi:DNA topoisomerase [Medicago truncatula]|uniref:DNA topoisomerase (ATP-hydrolyzing) n=1 Tax=Medicago truncatula TaxID=3880 RepID=G7KQ22_MEDTR|nr:DNA topoisomerase [Medicago truncatula]
MAHNLPISVKKNSLLRYGKIIIIANADFDGIHMKGLILYLIYKMWIPIVMNRSKFLSTINTLIIKAFTTLGSFEELKKKVDLSGWKIKYYKLVFFLFFLW